MGAALVVAALAAVALAAFPASQGPGFEIGAQTQTQATAGGEDSAARMFVREAWVARVIDGDTFVIEGGDRVRIRNFDTAELRQYACLEERAEAIAARDQARTFLEDRRVSLVIDRQDTRDRYGRLIADVLVLGPGGAFDFAERMTAAGAGARWEYGREAQPTWCPDLILGAAGD